MKGIIGLAAGLVVGFAGGYLTGRKALKKKFQAKLDNEISAIKDTQDELRKRKERKLQTEKAEKAEKAAEEYSGESEQEKPKIYISTDPPKENSESEFDPGGEDDDIGEFEADKKYAGLKEILKKDGKPYNITAEEFEANENKFDKVYVTYNSARDLVTDNQTGMTLDDGWYLIGGDAGCIEDDRMYDDGFYYVRNERISTDFCVDKCSVV